MIPVPKIVPQKVTTPIFRELKMSLPFNNSPIIAPNNVPNITPIGVNKRPITIPIILPRTALLEPPIFFVDTIGKTKSRIV